jgi:hypothetical protein
MGGILEDVLNVRTNGNGQIRSSWDHILLLRDLEQLISERRVTLLRDVPQASKYLVPDLPNQVERKLVQDAETGEIYEYIAPWERGGATFRKVDVESRYPIQPDSRPM